MKIFLSIIGGIVMAAGMLAIIAAGIAYDHAEYKARHREKKDED